MLARTCFKSLSLQPKVQETRYIKGLFAKLVIFRSSDGDSYDNVSSSSKEKKSSVLGRFLGRRNK